MRPTYTIVDLFETPARARVLRALALVKRPMSIRGVSRWAELSHTSAGAVLKDLQAMGIVEGTRVGRAIAFSLKRENAYVKHMVLPAIRAERAIVDELRADLADAFAPDSLSLILFGSFAYGEQTEASDIDVFALAEDELHKQALEQRASDLSDYYLDKYGAPLSLLVMSRARAAADMRVGQSPFRTELESTGIILHGLGPGEWGIDEPQETHEGSRAVGSASAAGESG